MGVTDFVHSIAVAMLLAGFSSAATADHGGSAYSRFGLGEMIYFPSDRAAGMAGATMASLEPSTLVLINPATWTSVNLTRYAVSARYEGFSLRSGSTSTYLSSMSFSGVSLGIPVSTTHGVTVAAGITPFTSVRYDVVGPATSGDLSYTLKHHGRGGLSQAHFGASVRLGAHLHLGTKFDYFFGTIEHQTEQLFPTTQFTSVDLRRTTRANGPGGTFGIIYSGVGNLLGLPAEDLLAIGGMISLSANLYTLREDYYEYRHGTNVVLRDTINTGERRTKIPVAAGIGMTYRIGDRIAIAGDLFYQNWKKFYSVDLPSADFRDTYRLSAGVERMASVQRGASFGNRTAYQAGMYYHAHHYRIGTDGIDEIGITGGVSFPIFAETRLGINMNYATRGTMRNQLHKDNILRVTFTLNGSERWFVRPELD